MVWFKNDRSLHSKKIKTRDLVTDPPVKKFQPDIVNATEGSKKVLKSGKFKKFLELVLLIGNYMNAGSRNQQSFGFDIDYLSKLRDSKSADNSMTMLHFLADLIENNPEYCEIKGFVEDLR